jgi:hypothetical protein
MCRTRIDRDVHHVDQRCRPDTEAAARERASDPGPMPRGVDVLQRGDSLLAISPKITRLTIHSVYAAPRIRVVPARTAYQKLAWKLARMTMNSPTKPEVPGRPALAIEKQHHEGGEPRHGVDHAAVIPISRLCSRSYSTPTHRNIARRDEAVRHHLHHAALHAKPRRCRRAVCAENHEGDEEAQRDEAHVRNRRVGDQLLHVLLDQRHEADVDDGDQRQGRSSASPARGWHPA